MQGITKLSINFSPSIACRVIVEDHLKAMGLEYELATSGSVVARQLNPDQHAELNAKLSRYGIELTEEVPNDLVEQIKRAVIEIVSQEEGRPNINVSDFLSKKLNYSYGYLTAIFSEATYTSISHFMILQKVERIKEMLLNQNLTLTEISYQLGYSSVAYLSNQFKMVTGLTPTKFKEIMMKKRKAVA
ncbi:MAG: AraC family transcriptional regulator [Ignavibacteriota bacterium]